MNFLWSSKASRYQDAGIYFIFFILISFRFHYLIYYSNLYPLPNFIGGQQRMFQTSQLNILKAQHMCIKNAPILWKEFSQENNRKKTQHTHILSCQWYNVATVHKRSKVTPRATIHIMAQLPVQEPRGNTRDMMTEEREVGKDLRITCTLELVCFIDLLIIWLIYFKSLT